MEPYEILMDLAIIMMSAKFMGLLARRIKVQHLIAFYGQIAGIMGI